VFQGEKRRNREITKRTYQLRMNKGFLNFQHRNEPTIRHLPLAFAKRYGGASLSFVIRRRDFRRRDARLDFSLPQGYPTGNAFAPFETKKTLNP
jgi:hypothetical protein